MRVVLLQNIEGLGHKFDVKEVKSGYVRNFLLPQKLVEIATTTTIKELEKRKVLWAEKHKEVVAALQKKVDGLKDAGFDFTLKVGEKDEVFSSVNQKDIEKSLKEKGFDKVEVELKKPIKEIGEHQVQVNFGEGIKVKLKIIVTGSN